MEALREVKKGDSFLSRKYNSSSISLTRKLPFKVHYKFLPLDRPEDTLSNQLQRHC